MLLKYTSIVEDEQMIYYYSAINLQRFIGLNIVAFYFTLYHRLLLYLVAHNWKQVKVASLEN